MGISANQGININMAQNVMENVAKNQIRKKDDSETTVHSDDKIKRVADDGSKDLGKDLISDFIKKAADEDVGKMNKTIQKNVSESMKNEIDALFKGEDFEDDGVLLSDTAYKSSTSNKKMKGLKNSILAQKK